MGRPASDGHVTLTIGKPVRIVPIEDPRTRRAIPGHPQTVRKNRIIRENRGSGGKPGGISWMLPGPERARRKMGLTCGMVISLVEAVRKIRKNRKKDCRPILGGAGR